MAEQLCLVSADSHIGPGMDEMRPYCEERYLDDFNRFSAALAESQAAAAPPEAEAETDELHGVWVAAGWPHDFVERMAQHFGRSRANDPDGRLRDMDQDGIVADVIFHGAQNGQPLGDPYVQPLARRLLRDRSRPSRWPDPDPGVGSRRSGEGGRVGSFGRTSRCELPGDPTG